MLSKNKTSKFTTVFTAKYFRYLITLFNNRNLGSTSGSGTHLFVISDVAFPGFEWRCHKLLPV